MLANWEILAETVVGNEHVRHVPLPNAEQIQIFPTKRKLLYSFIYYFSMEMDFVAPD